MEQCRSCTVRVPRSRTRGTDAPDVSQQRRTYEHENLFIRALRCSGIGSSPIVQFAVTVVTAVVVVPLATVLTPPDPYTQLLTLGLLLIASLPVAYALSYGGGYE